MTVERRPLPPIGPSIAIKRTELYNDVRAFLNDILNGPRSYYPDGGPMAWRDILSSIDSLIDAVESLYATANDPDDALRDIESDLLRFREAFLKANEHVEKNPPGAPLEIPPPFDNDQYFVRPTPPEFGPPPSDPVHPISLVALDESGFSIPAYRNGLLGFAIDGEARKGRVGGLFGVFAPEVGTPASGDDFFSSGYQLDRNNAVLPSNAWPPLPLHPGVLPRIWN